MMMTKQAELKKRAYTSNLKSRALSILIYLIDRSDKDLTCFPAIPTMAAEMHIGISTVKRALHELVDAGFIQKEARFRENNRGQSSNLYTLIFREEVPELTSNHDNNPDHGDYIAQQTAPTDAAKTEHITFADIAGTAKAPAQAEYADLLSDKKKAYGQYHVAKKEMQDILTAKANIDRLLGLEQEQKAKEKSQDQR